MQSRKLTDKELPIMQFLWNSGALFVREIVEMYPEPRPHFNTVATQVRILEEKGYVEHEVIGGSHRFRAIVSRDALARRSLAATVKSFFDNSYKNVVSALVSEEKISLDELREIIDLVDKSKKDN